MLLDTFSTYPASYSGIPVVLISLATPGTDKFLSDRDMSIKNGANNVQLIGLLSDNIRIEQISSELQSTFQDDIASIVISNVKDLKSASRFITDIQNNPGRSISVFWGISGDTLENYKLLFSGRIDRTYPYAVSAESVTINATGKLKSNGPITRKFSSKEFPSIDDESMGNVIPYVFGDWVNDTDGLCLVPTTWIGSADFKISDHAIESINKAVVIRNGQWKFFNFTADIINAELFLLDYQHAKGDKVYVQCKGYDIGGSIAAEKIDDISLAILRIAGYTNGQFVPAEDLFTSHIKMRRIVDSEYVAEDMLQEVLRECGYQKSSSFVYDGPGFTPYEKVTLKPFVPNFGRLKSEYDSTKNFQDFDVIGNWEEPLDPIRLYANRIEWTASDFTGVVEHSSEITSRGIAKVNLDYKWIYRSTDCQALASRELYRRIMRVRKANTW